LDELIKCCDETFQNNKISELSNPEQWPELADCIYYELKKNSKERMFNTKIKERMTPVINTTTLSIIKVILATKIQLTTNFDNSIESAYEFLEYLYKITKNVTFNKPQIKCVPDFGAYSDNSRNIIYYLHGNIKDDIYILRKTHYDMYYPSVSGKGNCCIEDCLKHYFKNKSIVFIGFSFSDKYIKQYVFNLSKEIERNNMINANMFDQYGKVYTPENIRHYLLIDSENDEYKKIKDEIFNEYKDYYIYPIVYKSNKHIFIEKVFELLSQMESS